MDPWVTFAAPTLSLVNSWTLESQRAEINHKKKKQKVKKGLQEPGGVVGILQRLADLFFRAKTRKVSEQQGSPTAPHAQGESASVVVWKYANSTRPIPRHSSHLLIGDGFSGDAHDRGAGAAQARRLVYDRLSSRGRHDCHHVPPVEEALWSTRGRADDGRGGEDGITLESARDALPTSQHAEGWA